MKYEKRIEAIENSYIHPSQYQKAVEQFNCLAKANEDLSKQLVLKDTELQENKEANDSVILELK